MTGTLLQDIITSGNQAKARNKGIYGKKGDTVTIISQMETVYIVELKGDRFPVHESNIKVG